MDQWRHRDIRADIQARCPFPVYLQNDATSACGAELVFGRAGNMRDFLYFYIGAFAGGGIVLNGSLYSGPTGNAGALGSMPVPGPDGRPAQLIDIASVAILERMLNRRGIDATYLWTSPNDWGETGADFETWVVEAGRALAYATVAASSVIDFEATIVDGWMPVSVRGRLVAEIRQAIGAIDAEGLKLPEVLEGTVGIHARALGAASLPLSDRFLAGAPGLSHAG
jgi:predicted NBD/HSP70 family sugar kinase